MLKTKQPYVFFGEPKLPGNVWIVEESSKYFNEL